MQTYDILHEFSMKNPAVDLIVMMGNHDVSRNKELKSSFEVLKTMCSQFGNIVFVSKDQEFRPRGSKYDILICPYNAFIPTRDMVLPSGARYSAAFGHWDTVSFGNDHNLMPLALLSKHTDLVVNGHEHSPYTRWFDKAGGLLDFGVGPEITCPITVVRGTGSMQPYSHGEDKGETLYVTRTIAQYNEDPSLYENKCLRLLIGKGEELPEGINALQIVYKYATDDQEEENTVVMEDFSFKTLFDECMTQNKVSKELHNKYWELYKERSSDATSS
jgi:hypothetical protein